MMVIKKHLGGAVYVEFDGFTLVLVLDGIHAAHRIVLEPEVYRGLVAFVAELQGEEADRG